MGLATLGTAEAQTTVTLPAVADTTLRQQNPNQNRGTETYLRIGHNQNHRGLVRFDQAAMAAAVGSGTLISAHLELFAETSNQWPASGRPVDVHRVTAAWTESGATWNCAIDTNPSGNQPDCASQWAGGSFATTATASLVHTSATVGAVRYDVTGDVSAFLAGTAANHGWLLKRRFENQSGRVDYTSKEGLAAANRPRLVLVFEGGGGEEDFDPPTITATVSPAPNAAGWHNSPVTVTFTCADLGSGVASCSPPVTVTTDGAGQQILGSVADQAGNEASVAVIVNLDQLPPLVFPDTPLNGSTVLNQSPAAIAGNLIEPTSAIASLLCNSNIGDVAGGRFTCSVPLTPGQNTVTVAATDLAGNTGSGTLSLRFEEDRIAPRLHIVNPVGGAFVALAQPEIALAASDNRALADETLALALGGAPLAASCQRLAEGFRCQLAAPLASGVQTLRASIADEAGNLASDAVTFTVDPAPVEIAITAPESGLIQTDDSVTVSGVAGAEVERVEVNGVLASQSGTSFSAVVPLREGTNTLVAVARKASGRTGTASIEVTRDIFAPIVRIDSPRDGLIAVADTIAITGLVNDQVHGGTEAEVLVNGVPAEVAGGAFLVAGLTLDPGVNVIEAVATDRAGNVGRHRISVLRQAIVGERITVESGNGQSAVVNELLSLPLVARVTDEVGNPVAGRVVRFAVTRNSGLVGAVGGAEARTFQVTTDGNGRVRASFRLGHTPGAGTHRVAATALGVAGEAEFCASAVTGEPDKILMTMGDNQRGVVGHPLPIPFEALVVDANGNAVAGVPVLFSVTAGGGQLDGAASLTRTTNGSGLARAVLTLGPDAGINNNVVGATFAANLGLPAGFTASGLVPGNPAQTRMTGVVLDNAHTAIPNATVTIEGGGSAVSALTDAEGRFELNGAPMGHVHLRIDPSTSPRPEHFPPLAFEAVTIAGQENTIGQPILIPALEPANAAIVGGSQDVTIAMSGVAGLNLTVFANSVTFPGGAHVGEINISQVHLDKVPMPPPSGTFFMPPAWTVQPHGVVFDPPARITIPNDGLEPGRMIDIYQFDHALNQFVNVGKGTVTEDAALIISDPGFGITRAGWGGCGQPPPPDTCADGCADNDPCTVNERCENNRCVHDEIRVNSARATADGQNPKLVRAPDSPTLPLNVSVNFSATAQAEHCQNLEYEWDFGDGQTGMGQSPTHAYRQPGKFTAKVTAKCQECPRAKAEGTVDVVIPWVIVRSADVRTDQIRVELTPANENGELQLELAQPGNHTIETVMLAGGNQTRSFNIPALAEAEYTQVRARWTIEGQEARGELAYHIWVLGTWRHSQYNVPDESGCTGADINVFMLPLATCFANITATNSTLRSDFAAQTALNGSGISLNHGGIKALAASRCNNTPAANRPAGANNGNTFVEVGAITGSCNQNLDNTSLARCTNDARLPCGAQIYIHTQGMKTVRDRCPACCGSGRQLDNFTTNAACRPGQIPDLGDFMTIRIYN